MNKNVFGVVVIIVIVLGFWYFLGSDTPSVETEEGFTYIEKVDEVSSTHMDELFSCVPAGEETARAGGTELRRIGDALYCVTTVAEGAAGSVYRQYAYATPDGSGTTITTFSLRFVQCANYDEEERTVCEAEQENFNPDSLLTE